MLGCMVVLFALLVRVAYVPFHLAVEEHTESHLHATAMDPDHCHSELHQHGHAHNHDEGHAHDGNPSELPHSEEEHDTELMLGRPDYTAPPLTADFLAGAELEFDLGTAPEYAARTVRGPPLPLSVTRSVEPARGPPSTV